MTAPQRVDPARIRKANRAATIARVALVVLAVFAVGSFVGVLAKTNIIASRWELLLPLGVLVGLPAFIVALMAGQLADRYRQPVAIVEDER